MTYQRSAKFGLGQIVRHTEQPFRGVVVDVDAQCVGPFGPGVPRDQPFYQVLAIGEEGGFMAYVPEQSLAHEEDASLSPSDQMAWFKTDGRGRFHPRMQRMH